MDRPDHRSDGLQVGLQVGVLGYRTNFADHL